MLKLADAKALSILGALLAGGYVATRGPFDSAHARVERVCRAATADAPIAVLESLAQQLGLQLRRSEATEARPAQLVAWDGVEFDRWFCAIRYRDAQVIDAQVFFLD
jgi:GAF domain-containing protein